MLIVARRKKIVSVTKFEYCIPVTVVLNDGSMSAHQRRIDENIFAAHTAYILRTSIMLLSNLLLSEADKVHF